MTWARSWAWLVAAGIFLAPAVLQARVPTRLVFVRAPSAADCPDEAALVKAVSARLGYDPFSPWGDQTILATIVRQGDELLGRAELVDHDGISQGSREVRLARRDCAELLLTLSLAISITLDPLYVEPPPGVEAPVPVEAPLPPAEPVTEPEASVPDPHVRRESPPKPRTSTSTTWHLGAAVVGAIEAVPGVAVGGRLGVGARRARWSLGLEVGGLLPKTRTHAEGGEARVRLTAVALVPCWRAVAPLALCGLASLGVMHAEGRGVEVPRSDDTLYPTLGARVAFAQPLGARFELVATADVAVAPNRPQFQLDSQDVWRPGPIVAAGAVGVAARFF